MDSMSSSRLMGPPPTEAFHRATLLNLAHGFATLVLVEDIQHDQSWK
jgi:hypothetical protein